LINQFRISLLQGSIIIETTDIVKITTTFLVAGKIGAGGIKNNGHKQKS
jgi:hypothetical protein